MIAAIAGYSGLIGKALLEELKADQTISEIRTIGRSEPVKHAKVRYFKSDFEHIPALQTLLADCEVVFCCLGTTIKTAGSKEAFRKVDYTYVVNLAEAAAAAGAVQFAVVSAIGADPKSGIFYTKVKGEMEEAVLKSGITDIYLFQPSTLLGDREEFRLGEKIGSAVMRAVSPIMVGRFEKYKPIYADAVATAMHQAVAQNCESGYFDYGAMIELIG